MLTKVEIAARVAHLDRMVQNQRATLASQEDARRELVDACHVAGDHVPYGVLGDHTLVSSFHYRCMFCSTQLSASKEQISRGLLRG